MSSDDSAASRRRLAVLSRQCGAGGSSSGHGCEQDAPQGRQALEQHHGLIATSPCSGGGASAVRSLPRFDPYIMETYLDDLRELKRQVYDLFKYKPELLPAVEEGMTKGVWWVCCVCMCVWLVCARVCVRGRGACASAAARGGGALSMTRASRSLLTPLPPNQQPNTQ